MVRISATILAPRADAVASINRGIANPAKIPKIAITTTNSTKVKPFLFLVKFKMINNFH